jgi:hypothetical protein
VIGFEREVPPCDIYSSMGMIDFLIPIIDELVCFDLHRSLGFDLDPHLRPGHLRLGGMGKRITKDGKDDQKDQDKPVISQDLSPGRK